MQAPNDTAIRQAAAPKSRGLTDIPDASKFFGQFGKSAGPTDTSTIGKMERAFAKESQRRRHQMTTIATTAQGPDGLNIDEVALPIFGDKDRNFKLLITCVLIGTASLCVYSYLTGQPVLPQ